MQCWALKSTCFAIVLLNRSFVLRRSRCCRPRGFLVASNHQKHERVPLLLICFFCSSLKCLIAQLDMYHIDKKVHFLGMSKKVHFLGRSSLFWPYKWLFLCVRSKSNNSWFGASKLNMRATLPLALHHRWGVSQLVCPRRISHMIFARPLRGKGN